MDHDRQGACQHSSCQLANRQMDANWKCWWGGTYYAIKHLPGLWNLFLLFALSLPSSRPQHTHPAATRPSPSPTIFSLFHDQLTLLSLWLSTTSSYDTRLACIRLTLFQTAFFLFSSGTKFYMIFLVVGFFLLIHFAFLIKQILLINLHSFGKTVGLKYFGNLSLSLASFQYLFVKVKRSFLSHH